jgi:branched-chain amino acid aminotransferase
MSFDQSEWVWMNGSVVPWAGATFHVSAHALHYGSGVFEGLRCYETKEGPAIFRLDAHLDRLYASAEVYGIEVPFSKEELTEAICQVIRRNGFSSCYVRPICFLGSSSLGLHPRACPVEVAILAWPWSPLLGDEGIESGVRTTVSPWLKFHSRMIPTTAKACGQYLNSILAVREAVQGGFDEALLLDTEGYVAEGSGENLFVVRNGIIFTNDACHSILMGITRDSVIEIARDLGYKVEITALRLEDLVSADEAFFTGTAAEVVPIREVDGSQVGSGRRGEVTAVVQRIYSEATRGRQPRYSSWLHAVSQLAELNA